MARTVEPYRDPTLPERFLRWTETLRGRIGTIPCFTYLDGSPEGVIDGQQGDLAFDRIGLAYYQKTTATGNTGWVALATGGGAAETLQQTYSASVPALVLVNAVSGTFEIRDSIVPQTPPFVLFQVSDSSGTSIFDVTTSSGVVNAGPQAGAGQVNLFHAASQVLETTVEGIGIRGTAGATQTRLEFFDTLGPAATRRAVIGSQGLNQFDIGDDLINRSMRIYTTRPGPTIQNVLIASPSGDTALFGNVGMRLQITSGVIEFRTPGITFQMNAAGQLLLLGNGTQSGIVRFTEGIGGFATIAGTGQLYADSADARIKYRDSADVTNTLAYLSEIPGAVAPGGVDTNVQFNDAGAFGGSVNLTWDDSTLAITAPTIAPALDLNVGFNPSTAIEINTTLNASYTALRMNDQTGGNEFELRHVYSGSTPNHEFTLVSSGFATIWEITNDGRMYLAGNESTSRVFIDPLNERFQIRNDAGLFLQNVAAAPADLANYGQLFIDTADNGLYYKFNAVPAVRLDLHAATIVQGTGIIAPTVGAYDYDATLTFVNANSITTMTIGWDTSDFQFVNEAEGATTSFFGRDFPGGTLKETFSLETTLNTIIASVGNTGVGGSGQLSLDMNTNTVSQLQWRNGAGVQALISFNDSTNLIEYRSTAANGTHSFRNGSGQIAMNLTPFAGQVIRHANLDVARTTTALLGGWEANNTLTGAGFERVLTVSDLGVGGFQGLGQWRYRTTTAGTPAAGQLEFDNATIDLATEMYLNEVNDNGVDMTNFLALITSGSLMYVQVTGDASKYVVCEVGTPTLAANVWTFPLTQVEGVGTAPNNNAPVSVVAAAGSAAPPTGTYTVTNVTTDRAYDANATTVNELADVLGTVIADLQSRGVLG